VCFKFLFFYQGYMLKFCTLRIQNFAAAQRILRVQKGSKTQRGATAP